MKVVKFLSVVAVLICSVALFASCDNDDDKIPPFKFSANKSELVVGGTVDITVTGGTEPYKAISSDEKIAKVSVKGKIITLTGVKAGKVSILVTDNAKQTGNINVEVKAIGVSKNPVSVGVGKEETVDILGGAAPFAAAVKDSKIATATVTDNKVVIKGVKAGKTTVTVTDKNKLTTIINVVVK